MQAKNVALQQDVLIVPAMTNNETTPNLPNPDFSAFEHISRSFVEHYAQLEKEMLARATQAIETWAQLAKDALAYSAQLTEQARKLGVDTARKFSS